MQQPFLVMRTNEKIHTNKIKAKSLAHLFKGGRSPEGGAIWSLLPQWETTFIAAVVNYVYLRNLFVDG
ncbi:unknown [Ruminococcus sp. CAG:353]|nr:unknown [Ruminococcus sp. CAG:353]